MRERGKNAEVHLPRQLREAEKILESEDFKKLSSIGKTNRKSDVDGVGPSLHTCGVIPMTEWRERFVRIACHVIIFKKLN